MSAVEMTFGGSLALPIREGALNMQADLHVHTTASDGTDSPEEVVARAAAMGLGALAIADHDTLEGIHPAMEEGRRRNLEVLPAIELGTDHRGREIHILGYMIDVSNDHLLSQLAFFRKTRSERVIRMVDRLNKLGFPITLERVLEMAGCGSVGRPHIARALVEKGFAKSLEEAFDRFIAEGRPGFEPRSKCTPAQAVHIIRLAGGVAVLAHPGLGQDDDLIPALIPEGLQGIEAYHPGHSPEASRYYLKICERHGLVATGGSDYHGENYKLNRLGACTVPCRVVDQIKSLAWENRKAGIGNRGIREKEW